MLACRHSAANNWRKRIFQRHIYFFFAWNKLYSLFFQEYNSKLMILSGKCDNYCELYATVHLSFCDHKVAPLKDWLKWLQNLQLTHRQVSLLDGFDFVWTKTIEKLKLSLLLTGLLVKLWDLSKSSPNRRLSEKVGVAKWFCKDFEFGELGLFWVGNKVVNSCLGGRSSDKARKWQTVSLLLLDDTLGLAEMPTHSGEHQQKQRRWFSYQTLMCTDYDLEYLFLTKTICKTGIPWSKHKCLVTKTGLKTKLWSPILFS